VPQDRLCRDSLHGVRIYNGGFEMKILVTPNPSAYGCTINHSARSRSLLYRIRGIRSLLRCKEKPVALNFHLAITSPPSAPLGGKRKRERA
jgi:hypothetical protein